MRAHRQLIFIPLLALLAVFPLILKGPSCGHDIEFHLRNWLEVSSQWKQGVLFPHWDFTAAWNSGEPRFVFYPPLSWTIGAILGLLLPWAAVPTTFVWLALASCGFAMYRLASEWTTPGNAVIAAAFYMVHPYMLFTFYERAAYAELLAAAWIPLLLLAVLRPRLTVACLAIPIALLWLTNAPAAVMGCYAFVLLGVVRTASTWRTQNSIAALREAAKIAAGAILGIGLAAFYVLPAAIEQRWVKITMPLVRGVRYQDNFLFAHIGSVSHDAILRTASLCGVALVALAAVFLAKALHSVRREPSPSHAESGVRKRNLLALFLLTSMAAFLLTSPSAVLWRHVPELSNLQFPWRFCAILGAAAAALLALAMPQTRKPHPVAAIGIALALTACLTFAGNHFFRQPCYPGFAVPNLVDDFYAAGPTDPTDEYTPIGCDPEALQHANPAFWMAANVGDPAPETAAADYSNDLARRLHFSVSAPVPRFVILNLRDYPAWKITVNGVLVPSRPHRGDGLIALPIAGGISKIDIAYAQTPDQTAGWIISALSAIALLAALRRRRQGA